MAVKMNGSPEAARPARQVQVPIEPSLGAAAGGGNTAHVTGPGTAPVDNSSLGPINDVQPGLGTADTHQSKNPKPVD